MRRSRVVTARHARAGIESSTSQKAGQLFDTTSGSATSMPSTTSPSRPNAIARRWSWWVSSGAPCSRSVGRIRRPSSSTSTSAPVLREFGREVAEPVALLVADEADAGDPGRRDGLGGHDGQRRHEVGHVRHVDVDPAQGCVAAAHDDGVGAGGHEAPHRREHVDETGIALHRILAEATDAHRAADHRRRGQRIARRRCIGLDEERGRLVRARLDERRDVRDIVDVGAAERRHHRPR